MPVGTENLNVVGLKVEFDSLEQKETYENRTDSDLNRPCEARLSATYDGRDLALPNSSLYKTNEEKHYTESGCSTQTNKEKNNTESGRSTHGEDLGHWTDLDAWSSCPVLTWPCGSLDCAWA